MAQIFATQRSLKAKAKQNQKRSKSLRRHQQPTIIQSLASVSRQASLPSSQSRSSLRKLSATKTKPRNSTIDELFGMGSGWLSDNESDPPGSGDSGSHSPQCNTSSPLTSPSGSVSVACVASKPGNISSPDVLLSPPSYLTPPLGEEEGDFDKDSGCRTINTGLHSPNGQRQKKKNLSLKKLNSFVKCKLNSTSLTKYPAKHTVDIGSSEEDDDLPAYTLREPPTSSPNSKRKEGGKMDTSKTDSKAPCVVDLDNQERLFLDTLQTHNNTSSPDSQPLGDVTNITFPDVFQTTDCPQSTEKMHSHSQQSEDSYTTFANKSPTHLESNDSCGDRIHTVDLTGDCSLVILSDSEEVSTSQHSTDHPHNPEGNRKVGRGKKRIISPQTLFKGAKELCDVPELRIKRWMCQSKPLLVEIFQRKVYSRRHESFITSAKNRALLQWQISTRLFSKGQVDVITDCLMKCFCYKDMDYFSYVMSVLYPECLVRIIMDFYSIPFDEAEKKMMGLHEDTEDADSDVV